MKKFWLIFSILLFAGVGYLFYQRHQAFESIEIIKSGTTYHYFGVKIIVSPSEADIRGFFKPKLTVPKVTFDFYKYGSLTYVFENVVASSNLLGPQTLVLKADGLVALTNKVYLESPFLELNDHDVITSLAAKKIIFQLGDSGQENVTVKFPHIETDHNAWKGTGRTLINVDGLKLTFANHQDKLENLEIGPVNLGVYGKAKDGRVHFQYLASGKGLTFESLKGEKLKIGPWELSAQNSTKELSDKRYQEISEEIIKSYLNVSQAFLDMVDKSSFQTELNQSISFSENFGHSMIELFSKVEKYYPEIDVQDNEYALFWKGMSYQDSKGNESIFLSPFQWTGSWQEKDNKISASGKGKWQKLKFKGETGADLLMEDISWGHNLQYQINYLQALKYNAAYYRNYYQILNKFSKNFHGLMHNMTSDIPENDLYVGVQKTIASLFSIFPDQGKAHINFGKIIYSKDAVTGQYENLVITKEFGEKYFKFIISNDFAIKNSQDPKKSLPKTHFELVFNFEIPWGYLLNLSRKYIDDSSNGFNLSELFYQFNARQKAQLSLDLKEGQFKLLTEASALLPKAPALKQVPWPQSFSKLQEYQKELAYYLKEAYFSSGDFNFKLELTGVDKFFNYIDRLEPGVSMAIFAVKPYVDWDLKKDTIKFDLTYENHKAFLNGKPNKEFQSIFDQWSKNSSRPSPVLESNPIK